MAAHTHTNLKGIEGITLEVSLTIEVHLVKRQLAIA